MVLVDCLLPNGVIVPLRCPRWIKFLKSKTSGCYEIVYCLTSTYKENRHTEPYFSPNNTVPSMQLNKCNRRCKYYIYLLLQLWKYLTNAYLVKRDLTNQGVATGDIKVSSLEGSTELPPLPSSAGEKTGKHIRIDFSLLGCRILHICQHHTGEAKFFFLCDLRVDFIFLLKCNVNTLL